MKKFSTFILLWLFWGFFLGTLLLFGPLRWTVDYGRENAWSSQEENSSVVLYITILLIISFIISLISANVVMSGRKLGVKILLVAFPLIGGATCMYSLMNPGFINKKIGGPAALEEQQLSTTFTMGPYPEPDKISELKARGYTAIVSLLHPAVVPFEPKLLEEEKYYAKQAGIELIHIPFVPWISENENSIAILRKLVKEAKGKYYIHCYLGKDRANVVRHIIEQENTAAIKEGYSAEIKRMDTVKRFERGEVIKLDDRVYLSPLPTKEEYFGFVLAAGFQQVVGLLDLASNVSKTVEIEESKAFQSYQIPYRSFNINAQTSRQEMEQIAQTVRTLPRPLLVYAFFSNSKEAKLFETVYRGFAVK